MATYFHGNSEIQGGGGADGLQTLVLMNPGYIQYSDTPPPPSQHGGNLVFFNSATAVAATAGNNSLPGGQQFVGIPLSTAAEQSMYSHHDVSSNAMVAMHGFAQRGHYNLWNTIEPNTGARDATRATQGLSLSLPAMSGDDVRISGGSPSSASGITNVVVGGGGVSGIQSVLLSSKYLKATQELLEEVVNVNNNNGVNKGDSNNNEQKIKKSFEKNKVVGESSHASEGDGSVGEGSGGKHESELSPIERQEIQMKKAKLIAMLDEVEQRYRQYHNHMQIVISSFEQAAGIGSARTYTALALKTISKQFRCLKECITGQIKAANKSLGSGSSEDNDNNNDDYNKVIEGVSVGSRLKYVDHHLRQQRAIQQLGMIHHHQHNAWRPQRGLPERSVSVLRAWLFEHFLHPYPKDSDKHMLAKQTGLTRSQVSNWFINARVRLWKPMVEEMYLEEMKDHEMNNTNNNGSEDKSSKNSEDPAMKTSSTTQDQKGPNSETEHRSFNSKQDVSPIVSVSTQLSSLRNSNNNNSGFSFNIGSSSELDGITQGSPKKPRNTNNNEIMHNNSIISIDMKPNNIDSNSDQLSMKFGGGDDNDDEDHRQGRDSTNGYSFIGNQTNFISGFGQYPIEEITRFGVAEQFTTPPTRFSISSSGNSNSNNNNNVSLTLGLPHCDTISGTHQTFLQNQNIQLGMRLEMSETSEFGASSAAFESINNMQNPKRFAAQLLPDFVA